MTVTIIDYRRTDLRTNVLENPYWITSAEFSFVASDDLCAILFSFSAANYPTGVVLIEKICCQITTLAAGGTITCDIGSYTIATDAVTTDGEATLVDVDEYIDNTEITHGTVGTYFPATGDWITASLLKTELTPVRITPADTTVPCICATIASDAAITAGKGRVHALIHEVPCV